MRGAWILFVTIGAASVLAGCADKKQASTDTPADTQQAEVQPPPAEPAAPPPAVEDDRLEEPKVPREEPKKVERPKPAPPPEPARPQVVNRDVTVPSGTEITVALREKVSTESGNAGQSFTAVAKEPIRVEGLEPIPAGSVVTGQVTAAERAGRVGGKAKLSLAFNRVELPDGKSYAISAKTLNFEGEGTAKGDVEKVVGGAVGGGILGGILGGKKGAGKGAAAGTIAGGIFAVATRGNDIVFDPGKLILVTLEAPVTIPMIISVVPGQNP
jgi:hypothetical protein